jgi:ribosomal protein L37AE/L43A
MTPQHNHPALQNPARYGSGGSKRRADCPRCEARTAFAEGWHHHADNDDRPADPIWRCGNCGHEARRVLRATKRQMALRRVRAKTQGT